MKKDSSKAAKPTEGRASNSRRRKKASTSSRESLEKQFRNLLSLLARPGSKVNPKEIAALKKKAFAIWNYTPTVCVFGQTGSGKSSLCNALFGEKRFEISAVEACTQEPQSDTAALDKKRSIRIVDMPGMGESHDKDQCYQSLYEQALENADLVLWALKSDSRAFASDVNAWRLIRHKIKQLGIPSLFLLTQADKIDPVHEWNKRSKLPGSEQMGNLLSKKKKVAEDFQTSPESIVEISATTGFNLTKLVMTMVMVLPDEKKTAVLGRTRTEVQSEGARKEAEEGFWRSLVTWCKSAAKTVWDFLDEHGEDIWKAIDGLMQILALMEKRRSPKTKKTSSKTSAKKTSSRRSPPKGTPPKKAASRTRQSRKPR